MSEDKNKKEHLTISQQIEKINALLRTFGREAVQEIKMMKDGHHSTRSTRQHGQHGVGPS